MRFHTSLPVANIDETISFYSVLFGADPVKVRDDYVKFLSDGLNISFHQKTMGPDEVRLATTLHLGFELPSREALDALHRRLGLAGLVSSERETSICCYASQDKFWVTDPDGRRWELYQLLADTNEKISASTKCCPVEASC